MTSDPKSPILDPADDGRQAYDNGRIAGETPPPPSPWADDAPTPTDAAKGILELATWLVAEAGATWHALSRATELARKIGQVGLPQLPAKVGLGSSRFMQQCELLDTASDLYAQAAALRQQLASIVAVQADPADVVTAAMVAGHLAPKVGVLVGRARAALVAS